MSTPCPLCQRLALPDLMAENELAVAFKDAFPVSPGHSVIVPRRDVAGLFELDPDDLAAPWLPEVKQRLDARHYLGATTWASTWARRQGRPWSMCTCI